MGFAKAIIASSGASTAPLPLRAGLRSARTRKCPRHPAAFRNSSSHSVSDAEQLSRNLGNPYDIIPIREVYDALIHTLQPVFKDLPFGLAEEKLQSRTRGNIVMGLANKFGYVMLNTSNKSELSTGYGTLYGDMAGGLSVLGDVYKGQVYALARYINRNGAIIPEPIPHKSSLRRACAPARKIATAFPEYDILDKVLYQYIERRQGPKEIKEISPWIDEALVDRILRLVNTSEYKRNQFCRSSGSAAKPLA